MIYNHYIQKTILSEDSLSAYIILLNIFDSIIMIKNINFLLLGIIKTVG